MNPPLQSKTPIAIIFVNIDWKKSRHESAEAVTRNLKKLHMTTCSIVSQMKPAVICCCEVGNVRIPMTTPQVHTMQETIVAAWKTTATEQRPWMAMPDIRFLHTDGEPYLTAWDSNQCDCRHGRILQDVYFCKDEPRTAQAFLCDMPGEPDCAGIDVINVHAPSGRISLKDSQRKQLVRNLLQSESKSRPAGDVGEAKFLIGGDLNTPEYTLSGIMRALAAERYPHFEYRLIRPTWGLHGDMCIKGGFSATLATGRPENHDPKHHPYGICWSKLPETDAKRDSVLHPLPARNRLQPAAAAVAPPPWVHAACVPNRLQPATEQLLPTTNLEAASAEVLINAAVLTDSAEFPPLPSKRTDASTASYGGSIESEAPEGRRRQWSSKELPLEEIPTPEVDRTWHCSGIENWHENELPGEETPTLETRQQELVYAIANAFLDDLALDHPAMESIMKEAIRDEEQWPADVLKNVEEVFRPIFFFFPNGTKDQTAWQHRDTPEYIRAWREISEYREELDPQANEPSAPVHFGPEQTQNIFHLYITRFRLTEATPKQKLESWSKNESKAEARLNRLCGSRHVAFAIWQVGLPDVRLPSLADTVDVGLQDEGLPNVVRLASGRYASLIPESPATEQRRTLPNDTKRDVEQATQNILNWLDMLAHGIHAHKQTEKFQTASRKSGTGSDGLTATEREDKERRAMFRKAKSINRRWQKWELTTTNIRGTQMELLQRLWNGTLEAQKKEPVQRPTMVTIRSRE